MSSLKGFQFKEPKRAIDCLKVIEGMSLLIDMYVSREEEWSLINLLTKNIPVFFWEDVIKKCVVDNRGKPLSQVTCEDLGLVGTIEAIGVFCQGIENLELPDIYRKYCPSISGDAIKNMIKKIAELEGDTKLAEEKGSVSLALNKILGDSI